MSSIPACSIPPLLLFLSLLFHCLQGTATYTIGCFGCNFHCKFCQNFLTSQALVSAGQSQPSSDEEVVIPSAAAAASSAGAPHDEMEAEESEDRKHSEHLLQQSECVENARDRFQQEIEELVCVSCVRLLFLVSHTSSSSLTWLCFLLFPFFIVLFSPLCLSLDSYLSCLLCDLFSSCSCFFVCVFSVMVALTLLLRLSMRPRSSMPLPSPSPTTNQPPSSNSDLMS